MGELLCSQIDLDTPGLEEVRRLTTLRQYAAALSAWRDYKVDSFRKANLGRFPWHGNQLNKRGLESGDFLVGVMNEQDYRKASTVLPFPFILASGISGSPVEPSPVNWLAQDANGNFFSDYTNFSFTIPLTVRYWQTGDIIYLNKWFQITSDFACNQKNAVDALDAATRARVPCNWSTAGRDAQASLSRADRMQTIIRCLGVLCKSLPGAGRPARWDDILSPVIPPVAAADRNLIPPIELAQIAISLVQDHPEALEKRYLTAGAVPNQRRNGLAALLLTALQFPEFHTSKELLHNGLTGLNDYLDGAFEKDGGMLEKSFNYNIHDAISLGELADWIRPSFPEISERIDKLKTNFYRFAAALSTPFARVPSMASLGPANPPSLRENSVAREKYLTAQVKKMPGQSDPLVAQIAGQFLDKPGTPAPAFQSILFPYSGFAVQRRDWRWDSPYLFLQANRPTRGHRSMGHNAIQIAAYGRLFLTTSGVPVYSPKQLPEEMRGDFSAINELLGEHSSRKLNTVLVDGESQHSSESVAQRTQETPTQTRWHTSPRFDFTEGFYDLGYETAKVDHRRQVIFIRNPGFWIVTDIFTNQDQKAHEFTQIWNFPPWSDNPKERASGFRPEEVLTDRTLRLIHTADPGGPNVWLYQFGSASLDYAKHFGDKDPYAGWFTLGFGRLIPAPTVNVHWKSPANSVLVTVIWPQPPGESPVETFQDLSPKDAPGTGHDTPQAGFSLELTDGTHIRYRASHDAQPLGTKDFPVTAQALLTLQPIGAPLQGLILGRTGAVPADLAFTMQDGSISQVDPVTAVQGFSWKSTPAGWVPNYE